MAAERKMAGKAIRYAIKHSKKVLAYGLARMGKEVSPYYFAKKRKEAFIKLVTSYLINIPKIAKYYMHAKIK